MDKSRMFGRKRRRKRKADPWRRGDLADELGVPDLGTVYFQMGLLGDPNAEEQARLRRKGSL